MPIQDRQAVASEIALDLDREIRTLEMQIEVFAEQLRLLQRQRSAARILAGLEQPGLPSEASGTPQAQLIRAKNVGDLAYQFLRDHCQGAVSIPNLYKLLRRTGANVGARTYMYKIVDDLVAQNLVEKDKDGRVRAKSSTASSEWKQTEVTQ